MAQMSKRMTGKRSLGDDIPASQVADNAPLVPKQEPEKRDVSNMVTQMKKATVGSPLSELYEHYKSLDRFSKEKQKIVSKWMSDKSCKWVHTYLESRGVTASTKEGEVDDYGSVYPHEL